jgi:glycosyltransferase involved in cell wall biosynthesis
LPPRGRLELLFFGFIRPYKGLDVLFDALALLGDSSIHLTVVGEPWCDREHLKAMLAKCGAPNVDLVLEYVTDVVAANAFARADLVVLPYRAASGSGVAAVAYRYGKPVLASRVGGLVDVVEDGVSGILVDPGSAQALAAAISRIDRATLAKLAPGVHLFARSFTWESLSQALLHFTPPQSSG